MATEHDPSSPVHRPDTPAARPPERPDALSGADGGGSLAGRAALVTGAAGGIGRACAVRLAAAGAHVHLVDLGGAGQALLATAEEIAAGPGSAEPHIADLTSDADLEALPADVDVLVNNAGVQHLAPIQDFPPDTYRRLQRIMLEAPFLLIRRMLPHMYAAGWGRIVNISSVHGLRASAYKSAYVAAKHGLEGLSKVAAVEGGPHGVTSNCVSPSYVRTPLLEGQVAAQAEAHGISEEQVAEDVFLTHPAVKRLIEPAEVAEAVAWLCGPLSGGITGTTVPVDGGWTAQ